MATWPSGIEGCLDTRGWQFDSWRGALLRATFGSCALLRPACHRVVSDPYFCQIQNRIAELKKAKRLLLLRGGLFLVNIFEWFSRWHASLDFWRARGKSPLAPGPGASQASRDGKRLSVNQVRILRWLYGLYFDRIIRMLCAEYGLYLWLYF